MSSPLRIRISGKSPTRRNSRTLEEKCATSSSLDISVPISDKSFFDGIKLIKDLKNYRDNFPIAKKYVSQIHHVKFVSVIRFTFYNICSQLLFIEHWANPNLKNYNFVWLIDKDSFILTTVDFNAMKLDISVDYGDITCEIGQISTINFPIPTLSMNKRTYTQSAVPMLLALHLAATLSIQEVKLMDAAYRKLTCFSEHKETLKILDDRLMMCSNSIYTKYGFVSESGSVPHLLCKLTLRDILVDYKIRINNRDFLLDQLSATLVKTPHQLQEFNSIMDKAVQLMQQIKELKDKDMTLKEWLSLYTDEARNCRVVLLKSLTTDYLNADFEYDDVTYRKGKFLQLYDLEKDKFLVNTDVFATIKQIYNEGFS